MKILFVIDSLIKGGKERRLVELIKGIEKTDIDYRYILLTDINEFKETENFKVRPIIIKRRIKKDPAVFYKLYKICREFKPDIINTWGFMPSFYTFPIAGLCKAKFVNSMIIDCPAKLDSRTKILSRPIFKYSDVIASNSNSGLDAYKVKSGKTVVIRNGFDFSRTDNIKSTEEIKNEFGVKNGSLVCMVAAFRIHKDHETLIAAARNILSLRHDVTFLLVGDGPTLEKSKEMSMGESKIIFTGKRSDIESIINACDLCVLSTYTEGISNSIMEYMALGKAVIATDGGGTKELVEDGVTGILVPARSPQIFSEKIIQLLDKPELRNKMGVAGKEKIAKDFSIEKMVSDYISLFERTLK